jgi:hypothetical protein
MSYLTSYGQRKVRKLYSGFGFINGQLIVYWHVADTTSFFLKLFLDFFIYSLKFYFLIYF